jgi:hypothetical protein
MVEPDTPTVLYPMRAWPHLVASAALLASLLRERTPGGEYFRWF